MTCRRCRKGGCDNIDSHEGLEQGGTPCETMRGRSAEGVCRKCRSRVHEQGKASEPFLSPTGDLWASPCARARETFATRTPPRWATLEALAARVAALGISRHDPEAFHLAKDDVAKALRRLARELRRAA